MSKTPVARPAIKPDRPGQAFQDLVALIDRSIAGQEGVTMETNVLVRDADGDLREHDILLTHREGLRITKTAIECKDHGRKIGKPELEAFRSKCADTGIHKGVIVSSSGFAQSALKASRRTNVQCLELAKVETFPWVGMSVSVVTQRHYSNIDVRVFARTAIKLPMRIFANTGTELDGTNFQNVCQIAINGDFELSRLGRDQPVTFEIRWTPEDGVHVIDVDGTRHEADFIILTPTFTVTETAAPFTLHSYSGDSGTIEVAVSDFKADGLEAKLLLIRDDEGFRFTVQGVPLSGDPLILEPDPDVISPDDPDRA